MANKIILYLLMGISLIGISLAADFQAGSFTGQANPFNITFTGNQNQSYLLNIPFYAYVKNISMILDIYSAILPPNNITIFADNFDRGYDPDLGNGWKKNYYAGTNITVNNLLNVTLLSGCPNPAYQSAWHSFNNTPNRINQVNFAMRGSLLTNAMSISFMNDSNDLLFNIIVDAGRIFLFQNGSGYFGGGRYNDDQWYNFSIKNINYTTYTYDAYINETLILPNYAFKTRGIITNISFSPAQCGVGSYLMVENLTLSSNYSITSNISIRAIDMIFNGTPYVNSVNISANITKINSQIVSGQLINVSFHSDSPGILQVNLVNSTYSYGIDSCTNSLNIPSNSTSANITIFDYNGLITNVTYSSIYNYWVNPSNVSNFTLSRPSLNNTQICTYPNWTNISSNVQISYTDANSIQYDYFMYNAVFNNVTQQINLYTQNGTYSCLISVYDSSSTPITNAYITVLKQNVALNTFTTTEILKTDSAGYAIGNFQLNNVYYRFVMQKDGSVIYTADSFVMIPATSSACPLACCKNIYISSSDDSWFSNAANSQNVQKSVYWNNDTGNFVFDWFDAQAVMHYACMKVTAYNTSTEGTVFDSCTLSTAGTIFYHPSQIPGTRYVATAYLKFDDIIPVGTADKFFEKISNAMRGNKTALFIALFICLFLLFLGLWNEVYAITLLVIGCIVTAGFGLLMLSIAGIATILILSFVNHIILARRR